MGMRSHVFLFPRGADMPGAVGDSWVWQDDDQHVWQDDDIACWQDGSGPPPPNWLWPDGADLELPDGVVLET